MRRPYYLGWDGLRNGVSLFVCLYLVAFRTGAWVACLDHEVAYDTMECHSIVHAVFHVLYEVVPVSRGVIIQSYFDVACCGLKYHFRVFSFCPLVAPRAYQTEYPCGYKKHFLYTHVFLICL